MTTQTKPKTALDYSEITSNILINNGVAYSLDSNGNVTETLQRNVKSLWTGTVAPDTAVTNYKVSVNDLVMTLQNGYTIAITNYFKNNGKNSFQSVISETETVNLIDDGMITNLNLYNAYNLSSNHDGNDVIKTTINTTNFNDTVNLSGFTRLVDSKGKAVTNFKITTNKGNDTVTGSTVADDIKTGDGNDSVIASKGNDIYNLGNGNDTLTYLSTTNVFAGNDTINLTKGENFTLNAGTEATQSLAYTTDGKNVTVSILDNSQNLANVTFKNSINLLENVTLNGSALDEQTFSVITDKNYTGTYLNENISASLAKKGVKIQAGDGNNSITGSKYNDVITSGSGNDTVTATDGYDTYTLGTGTDSIIYDASNLVTGVDTVKFKEGENVNIQVNNMPVGQTFAYAVSGNDIVASLAPVEYVMEAVIGANGASATIDGYAVTTGTYQFTLQQYALPVGQTSELVGKYLWYGCEYGEDAFGQDQYALYLDRSDIVNTQSASETFSGITISDVKLYSVINGEKTDITSDYLAATTDATQYTYNETLSDVQAKTSYTPLVIFENLAKNNSIATVTVNGNNIFDSTMYFDATNGGKYTGTKADDYFEIGDKKVTIDESISADTVTVQTGSQSKGVTENLLDLATTYSASSYNSSTDEFNLLNLSSGATTFTNVSKIDEIILVDSLKTKYTVDTIKSDDVTSGKVDLSSKVNNFALLDDNTTTGLTSGITINDSSKNDIVIGNDNTNTFNYTGGTDYYVGGTAADTYKLDEVTKKTNLTISEQGNGAVASASVGDALTFASSQSSDYYVFNVNTDGTTNSNTLYIFNEDVLSSNKNLNSGYVAIENYLASSLDYTNASNTVTSANNHGAGFVNIKYGTTTVSKMDSLVNEISTAVVTWLENNGNYSSSTEVFASGNNNDIDSLLVAYVNANNAVV